MMDMNQLGPPNRIGGVKKGVVSDSECSDAVEATQVHFQG
jgi:hypothetical protein